MHRARSSHRRAEPGRAGLPHSSRLPWSAAAAAASSPPTGDTPAVVPHRALQVSPPSHGLPPPLTSLPPLLLAGCRRRSCHGLAGAELAAAKDSLEGACRPP